MYVHPYVQTKHTQRATLSASTHMEITFSNNVNGISSQSFTVDSVPNQLAFRGKMIAPEGMGIGMKAGNSNRRSSLIVAWSVYMHAYSKHKMMYKLIVNTNSQYTHTLKLT